MKIGIIGAGHIGGTAARLFARAGHEVAISNSRGPESLKELVAEIGHGVKALTADEAAAFGEIVLLAVPWVKVEAYPKPEQVRGKIVIDAMNPYGPHGLLDLNENTTSSEEVAKRLPGARLVKAFNGINWKVLGEEGDSNAPEDKRIPIYVAGDDAQANKVVMDLVRQIGFGPVETGSLRAGGRKQQAGSQLYVARAATAADARDFLAKMP
jgi:predicted dinucleotide-binding enzyme